MDNGIVSRSMLSGGERSLEPRVVAAEACGASSPVYDVVRVVSYSIRFGKQGQVPARKSIRLAFASLDSNQATSLDC